MIDPRPDLTEDSILWTKLLELAIKRDKLCAGVLHGFRCGGLRISKKPMGYVLVPMLNKPELSMWTTKEEYAIDRKKWLWPCTGMIISLLEALEKEVESDTSI